MKPRTLFRSFNIWVQTYHKYTFAGYPVSPVGEYKLNKVLARHRRRLARLQTI